MVGAVIGRVATLEVAVHGALATLSVALFAGACPCDLHFGIGELNGAAL